MYSKVVIFMCAAGIASAGNLLAAAPAVAYSSAPAVSSVSFTSHSAHGPVAYASGPVAYNSGHVAYSSGPVAYSSGPLAYSSGPVITKTLSPVTTYSSPIVSKTYSAPVVQYGAPAYSNPIVAKTYSSISHAAPVAYAAKAYSVPTYSAPTYSAPTYAHSSPVYSTYAASAPLVKTISAPAYASYSTPIVTKNIAPAVSYSSISHAPVSYAAGAPAISYSGPLVKTFTPAVQTYAAPTVVKTGLTYSDAPAVSHVSYSSLGSNYGW